MEITVLDLIKLMFDDEPLEVVSMHNRFRVSGCYKACKARTTLSADILDAPVRYIWHSVMRRLVIVID